MPRGRAPARKRPVPHTRKMPKLAATGTRLDRLCAVCLGRLEPGSVITFCDCGKFFHVDCITRVGPCPLCGYTIGWGILSELASQEGPADKELEGYEADLTEIVYQCPICDAYVQADAETCACGAVFDSHDAETFLCPSCGAEVDEHAQECHDCGMTYD